MALLRKSEETWITGEELFQQPDLGRCDLVEGRIVPMTPTGYFHGVVEFRLAAKLVGYADQTGRGIAFGGEAGILIRRNPDTVRAADAAFISNERSARRSPSSSYLDVAPELVVEILSPDDRWSDVMEKLSDYFSAGVDAAWVLDPKRKEIYVYRSLNEVQRFGQGQILTDEELLPGFSLSLDDLFHD